MKLFSKKIFKGIFASTLAVALLFSISACKGNDFSKEQAVKLIEKSFSSFLKFNESDIKKYSIATIPDVVNESSEYIKDAREIFKALAEGTTYEIGSADKVVLDTVPSDSKAEAAAKCVVTIKYKDLVRDSSVYYLTMFSNLKNGKFDTKNKDSINEETKNVLEKIKASEAGTDEQDIDIELLKIDGKWKVNLSEAAENLLLSGAGTQMKLCLGKVKSAAEGKLNFKESDTTNAKATNPTDTTE